MEIDFYSHIKEENDHLEALSKLSRVELQKKMKTLLPKFIRNKVLVDIVVSQDLFLSEFAFLSRTEKSEKLRAILAEIYVVYDSASKINRKQFLELIANFAPDVARAADNCAQMDNVLSETVPSYSKAAAKVFFRELGDFLEGSFQVFTKFFLSCVYISESKCIEEVKNFSFGKCVSELINRGILIDIYKPEPWAIPLSQWRNIANHNSYTANISSEQITCEYGSKTKEEITTTLNDLYILKFQISQFYNAHKISHATIFLENGLEVNPLIKRREINPETLIHQVKEFSFVFGFKPKLLEDSVKHKIDFSVTDSGFFNYGVVNEGSIFDVNVRANQLARRVSSFMTNNGVQICVYASNGERILSTEYVPS